MGKKENKVELFNYPEVLQQVSSCQMILSTGIYAQIPLPTLSQAFGLLTALFAIPGPLHYPCGFLLSCPQLSAYSLEYLFVKLPNLSVPSVSCFDPHWITQSYPGRFNY